MKSKSPFSLAVFFRAWHWAEVEDPTKVIFLDVDGVLDPQVNFCGSEGRAGLTLDSNRCKVAASDSWWLSLNDGLCLRLRS